MPTRLWLQFAGLLLVLQWLLGALLLLVPAFDGQRIVLAVVLLLALGLLWRIGAVFGKECGRLKVGPGMQRGEALLLGLWTALPTLAAGIWSVPDAALVRWLVGPVTPGAHGLLSMAGLVLHGWVAWLLLPLLAFAAFFIPGGLIAAPAEPSIRTQPVALTPPPKPAAQPEPAAATETDPHWKPVRRVKDVLAERGAQPGRLAPTNEDPPGF